MRAPVVLAQSMPAAVRRAGVLLWISVGIGVLTLAVSIITLMGRLRSVAFAAPILLMMALWIGAIMFTMRRNNIARFVIFALVAYTAFNLIRFQFLIAQANPGALVSLLELALRLYACYLLLRPESNAWFGSRQSE